MRRQFAGNVLGICAAILEYVDALNDQLFGAMSTKIDDIVNSGKINGSVNNLMTQLLYK